MHILIAPNAFKGSLSAEEAAKTIAEGLRESEWNGDITLSPIADGGDGTASLLNKYWNAESIPVPVHDPLGRMMTASFGWIQKEKKAVIDISEASGIKLLRKGDLNPLHAHTFGTGELIKAALDKGAEKIIIGVGGSATVDGGTGLLKGLGIQYFDEGGNEIHDLPLGLLKLSRIHITRMHERSSQVEIVVLCDVQNKLLGDEGAARIFGPQKGADDEGIVLLEQCMKQWNDMTILTMHRNMATLKYGGAAGGIAAGLAVYTQAKLVSGIDYFLSEMHFETLLQEADLIITGEGSMDEQTLEGKGPFGIACMAKKKDIPVIGLAGQIRVAPQSELYQYFRELIAINPPDIALASAIKDTSVNLKKTSVKLGNSLATLRNKR
ncbi:MAG: glycerate kinase [Chitinophagaceae bacterium]|nr:MAG: glycerate kinase [Chitinophagaceae bacterium]